MSRVMCHVSHVTYHMSHVTFFFGQSGEAHWWRVCFQRGLTRLVYLEKAESFEECIRFILSLPSELFILCNIHVRNIFP